MSRQHTRSLYGVASLVHYLVGTYFAHLSSVLIVYDSRNILGTELQQLYLDNVQLAFANQSKCSNIISLQWINAGSFKGTGEDLEEHILGAVDIAPVEGFITILANTSRFLHARYYATRYTTLRLKDKIYLFLCASEESPKHFLATEILQFYPHHLMVIPETIYPESNNESSKKLRNNDTKTQENSQNQKSKQTSLAGRTASNYLNVTNVTKDMLVGVTTAALRTATVSSLFYTSTGDTGSNKYRDINFELWTQQYVGAEGNLNAIHLDTYLSGSGTFAKNVQLYPNKLLNLQQRTVRIGSLTYIPYAKTSYVPAGQGDVNSINSKDPPNIIQFLGTEAEITKTFCQKHNCNLRVKPYADDDWGFIYENGTAEGIMGDIYMQHTELAIGCIYNWYNNVTEISKFIARSAVTILGPGPAQYPRWRTIVMPFSYSLWLFLVFAIVLCSTMFHVIKYATHRFENTQANDYGISKDYERTLLDIFAVFIQQPSADTVLQRTTTRIFLVFLLSATITLENTYSGQLKSILTMPLFNEPVDTMLKWSLTDWKWAAPSIAWIHTVEKSDLHKEQRLTELFEVRNHEFMYNASFRSDYGIGLERLSSGFFSFGEFITKAALENKIVIKDDLYFDYSRAVTIRGWPLMHLFDRHVSCFLESGIFLYWEKQLSYKFLDNQLQDMLKQLSSGAKPKLPPQMLSIAHVSGPLFILVFGYSLAFLVLMIELFGPRVKQTVLTSAIYLKERYCLKHNQ